MLLLQGQYEVGPTKRLTIITDAHGLPRGTLLSDVEAVVEACAANGGQCDVQVNTAYGVMQGRIQEYPSTRKHHRYYQGHMAFLRPALRADG
ncbi:hypothetical protein LAJ19_12890 [Deinococcus taeanensis]|uniref:hypothetical protein n=1 Tax=Deinococcus taeanensis TaxID=2737050 RepID=UPI001CDBF22E|nr:hypothetical protein [Deinococcus taeanensis]UBV42506.1 hypothetical protein LAJ19_12890 [Deinococcus taeanensis]